MIYLQNKCFPYLITVPSQNPAFFVKYYPENVHRIVYYFIYKYAIMCKIGLISPFITKGKSYGTLYKIIRHTV